MSFSEFPHAYSLLASICCHIHHSLWVTKYWTMSESVVRLCKHRLGNLYVYQLDTLTGVENQGNSDLTYPVHSALTRLYAQSFGFRTTSSSFPSSLSASAPTSDWYSHCAVSGKLIRILSTRAPGVLRPNFVPLS